MVSALVLIDTIWPQVTILAPGNLSKLTSNTVPYSINIAEKNIDKIWYVLDGGAMVIVGGNGSISVLDGTHVLRFYANDTAGHVNVSAAVLFAIDTINPFVTITSPSNGTSSPSATITLTTRVMDANFDSIRFLKAINKRYEGEKRR
ncbi:MAG: hypothetical protein GYA24_08410 [Candidatus Lokiarchaeota archaeon]|nr:hypothetical protein [Candidatus Lokiarchaeota archaeon]